MTEKRVSDIKKELKQGEALLVTSTPNRIYFTGFQSSAGNVLITENEAYFLIDFRYFEKAKATVNSCTVLLVERVGTQIKELCDKHNVKKLYIETYSISVNTLEGYKKTFEGIEVLTDSKMDKIIEQMRSIKTAGELELIKQAQALTDDTFTYILNRISEGRTEKEVMLDMEFYMRGLGSEGVSFDFIVVSGKNSSLPHGVPTDKRIEKGDFVTMDFGAVVNSYRSDMTRTVAVGSVSDEQKKVYDTVLKAQLAALKAIKAGERCCDIDKISRDIIYSAGYEGCFGHGLGHSVGIEIHENPNFGPRCETVLKPGTVMTVEPGIYLENKFGVRIEDMVYVTDDGCINLTNSKKELIIV